MVESVLNTLAGLPGSFPKSILEQVFCREPLDTSFCTNELCNRYYLKNLPEFLKHKAEDCSLHTCNLLKRNFNTELFLKIFQSFQNTCKKFGQELVFSSVGTCRLLKENFSNFLDGKFFSQKTDSIEIFLRGFCKMVL